MTDLPRVEGRSIDLDPNRSIAVELCLFRLCDYASADVRASTREERDEAYREHLRRDHADDLARLAHVLDTPPASRITLNLGPAPEPEVRFVPVDRDRLR